YPSQSLRSVTVGCLASSYSPDPAIFTWTSNEHLITDQVKTYPSVLNKNGLYTLSSQLTIAESQLDNIHCKVAHKSNTWPPVEIPMPGQCCSPTYRTIKHFSPEDIAMRKPTTAICFIYGFRPDSLSVEWLKDWQPIHSGVVTSPSVENNGTFSTSSRLTGTAREGKRDSVYTCKVTHQPTHTITVKNITNCCETPEPVKVSFLPPSPKQVLMEPISLTLSCLVKNFAPKEIFVEWTVNDQLIDANKYKNTELMADSADYSTYSMLSISAGDWDRGYSYSCVVGHEIFPLKTLTRAVNKSSGKPSFVNISLVLMDTVNACQ
uniref:Ig-like domain-containing protein n=1 Tax=Callorhinchus milii TaxID=7868 RepID=A0A4W3GS06_CALMI